MDLVELTFKDQYIGRGDMWRLKKSLVRPLLSSCVGCRRLETSFTGCKENEVFYKVEESRDRTSVSSPGELVL